VTSRIRAETLSLDEVVAAVTHEGAGGIATFLGVVRNVNDGLAVSLLEYEAYGSMAETELARILEEIEREIPGVRVAATHRGARLASARRPLRALRARPIATKPFARAECSSIASRRVFRSGSANMALRGPIGSAGATRAAAASRVTPITRERTACVVKLAELSDLSPDSRVDNVAHRSGVARRFGEGGWGRHTSFVLEV
jgi:hypothetical protein